MTADLLRVFGLSLALTLAVELTLAAVFGVRSKRGLLIVLLANVLTNPAAVFLCLLCRVKAPELFLPVQLAAEVLAVLAEGFVYGRFREDLKAGLKPFLLSLILNACSYGAGLICNLFVNGGI